MRSSTHWRRALRSRRTSPTASKRYGSRWRRRTACAPIRSWISADGARIARPAPVLVGDDRRDDDAALDDLLVVSVDPQEGEPGGHHTENECADNRARDPSYPAGERGTTDHCGRDRIQLVHHAHARLTGLGACRG